ncbi:hypothetical protein BO221_18320 [Archangium sp. Cb G35]|uniref:DUF2092 domain-containing protein n=1 Tax=Archangium sp. Cb G35 TaxID=1920190 RepID=UPI0009371EAB|nr:DUF2092 domain-containing protein [Archangium sp. Cb G35]OJT23914.1 hypothetical protein BO221_18320 [Archangium sp. Cb G35]
MKRRRLIGNTTALRRWAGSIAVLAAAAGGTAWAAPEEAASAQKSGVSPKARSMLEKMSDFLGGQRQFTVQVDGSTEVVLQSGEKVEFNHDSEVRLKRPDKLRSDRRGEKAEMEFYYDGRSFTLYGENNHYYATARAPATIDEAIDAARERLGIEAPAADLLYSKPYDILMEDVVSGTYLGTAFIRGATCHHLAFRGNETDWQIWIDDGPKPVPCKFVITSKKVEGSPEFTAEFSRWNFSPRLGDEVFHFSPPGNAKRIDFLAEQVAQGKQGDKK